MRHDWIFDVLADLKAYATANGMPLLAAKADEALAAARDEVARIGGAADPANSQPPGAKSP